MQELQLLRRGPDLRLSKVFINSQCGYKNKNPPHYHNRSYSENFQLLTETNGKLNRSS